MSLLIHSMSEFSDIILHGLQIAGARNIAEVGAEFGGMSQQLAAYEDCKAWFFHTWKTATRLSGWDARIALSSFERSLLS